VKSVVIETYMGGRPHQKKQKRGKGEVRVGETRYRRREKVPLSGARDRNELVTSTGAQGRKMKTITKATLNGMDKTGWDPRKKAFNISKTPL